MCALRGAALLAGGLVLAAAPARGPAFPAVLELASIDGTNGFVVNGVAAGDWSGAPVVGVGDMNGDGVDDLAIAAAYASPDGRVRAGEVYVVFGTRGGFPPALELASLDGTNGFALKGIGRGDFSGYLLAGAGDVNGDGLDDLIISSSGADPDGGPSSPRFLVVLGRRSGFPAVVELASLDGRDGFTVTAGASDLRLGSGSGAGDVNGDGVDDLVIGSIGAEPEGRSRAGQSHVVFGRREGFPAVLELASLGATDGFTVNGVAAGDHSGMSVSGVGDVNADGVDDLLIGTHLASPGGRYRAGQSYVVFGSPAGFPATVELASLDGTDGFTINGADPLDLSGARLSGAGDVNGDGAGDLLISAPGVDRDGWDFVGRAYVVLGTGAGFPPVVELSALDGTNGFAVDAVEAYQLFGLPASAAGDVNGDGLADVALGARHADPDGRAEAGQSHVVFGRRGGFPPAIPLASLDGADGFTLNGAEPGDVSGFIAGAGDVDGDGVDDLLVGAVGADLDGRANAGRTYVVFGCRSADRDADGLSGCAERAAGTDAGNPDSDGDGFTDGAEVAAGSDATDAGSVPDGNRPPAITSTPGTAAMEQLAYGYDAAAVDPDPDDRLSFSLGASPAGMRIDPASGAVRWTPAAAGTFDVTVRVDDGRGGIDVQPFVVVVAPGAEVITYGYDRDGRLDVVRADSGEVVHYDYDAAGNVVARTAW